ncbi:MAG: NADH-quinone oxidoreductase subunit N [Thiohalocapsa sp.]|jgi:NADH-quinone oxidoreductase subunit N|uniref:NADH-quinone oxidoreductase subunit N n=1 Tax=Thiohalocapsa sp. TaxID=2497641 RepID=UPI0025F16BBB|nr:NADH-quinone oxidoreductase subunit N [Thiohalocapsa sp.]MCG6941650.1 NADH-quinone oxidoreductase subunit N [Thiohalocapsa sp.]
MPLARLVPELAVLLAAIVVILSASLLPRRQQGFCALLAALGLVVAAAAAGLQLGWPAALGFSGTWAIDRVTVWAKLIILGGTLLVLLMSPEWLRRDPRHGEYYAVLLFATVGALMMAGAADTMELVIGVLLSSTTGYTLAAYHRGDDLSVEAGMKFFLVGALANALLLIGVVWLFGLAGSTEYAVIKEAVGSGQPDTAWLVAATFVVIGLCFKLGAVPAHTWMPDAAQGAPVPAAGYLTVVPKVGAAVALARLGQVLGGELAGWSGLIATLAVLSMTLGNLAALRQTDVRRLLGWSSVSQSGYLLVAVAMIGRSGQALPALIVFLAGYAAANLAAFAVVARLRGRADLQDYRGLARARPWSMLVLTIALLSLLGIPPLVGFAGKLLLMLAAVDGGLSWLAVAVVLNSVISLFYYARVIGPMYFEPPPPRVAVLGPWAQTAMLLAGALTVGLGFGVDGLLRGLAGAVLLP